MTDLFSSDLPIVETNDQLELIKRKYPPSEHYYVCSACIRKRREHFNKLWAVYEPYCDSHFRKQIQQDFHARTWEMYLGCVFLSRDLKISPRDHGPDIKLALDSGPVWVEAVVSTQGTANDRVPESVEHVVMDVPHDQMLLRLANSLDTKGAKFSQYKSGGIVRPDEPCVIAINRGLLEHGDPEIPLILKCLFSLGYFTLIFSRAGESATGAFLSHRDSVEKKSGSPVSLGFFQDQNNDHISAVIYSATTVLNHPDRIGADCILIPNPLARNPIDIQTFDFLTLWEFADDRLRQTKPK